MNALTVWQPYASLIVIGAKIYETRSWPTSHRGETAIHAAKKPTLEVYRDLPDKVKSAIKGSVCPIKPEDLPTGVIVGTGKLVECHKIDRAFISRLSERENLLGDFTPGRYAWEFACVIPFENPVPVRGAQGLWKWKGDQVHGY